MSEVTMNSMKPANNDQTKIDCTSVDGASIDGTSIGGASINQSGGKSTQMNPSAWSSDEIRQLRYRLGWSRAEMARHLKLDLEKFNESESGQLPPSGELRSTLVRILYLADATAEKVQRRPIAEVVMKDLGLSQIHDLDVEESFVSTSTSASAASSVLASSLTGGEHSGGASSGGLTPGEKAPSV